MRELVNHEKFGVIEYTENFWTGRKKIYINGQELKKIKKGTYEWQKEDGTTEFCYLGGNFLKGATLMIKSDTIPLTEGMQWYEYLMAIILIALPMVWGSIPSLCLIIPIVGGVVGGVAYTFISVLSIVIIKKTDNIGFKLLIWVIALCVEFVVGFLLALLFIDILLRTQS